MLKLDSLPEQTRQVFDHLSSNNLLRGFTLIGGTALALQIGHRKSEDLAFWLPAVKMNKEVISSVVSLARQSGFAVQLAMKHEAITSAKINGHDLLAYAQDYMIGGVKVTFFARDDTAFQHFNTFPRVPETNTSFGVMSIEGLFSMKSYVIHQRVRSRDLFDLKTFIRNGQTIGDILRAGPEADPAYSIDHAKSVLIGNVPLDKKDEGFDSVGVNEKIEDIYAFFKDAIDNYEQTIAEETFASMVCHKCNATPCVCDKNGSRPAGMTM